MHAPSLVETPALRQRLDLLHHLLDFGRQVILVTGPEGSGRTRLLQAVADEASPGWIVLHHHAFELATPQRLLAAIMGGLRVGGPEGEPALRRLRAALTERHAAGKVSVLLVDDAGELEEGCLSLLSELAFGGGEGGELRVVLVATAADGIADRLVELLPQPALLHLVEMPGLDLDGAHALARQLAAGDGERLPDDDTLEALWQRAAGRPGPLLAALSAAIGPPASTVPPVPAADEGPPAGGTPEAPRREPRPPGTPAALRRYLWLGALCVAGVVAGGGLHMLTAQRRDGPPTEVELLLPGSAPAAQAADTPRAAAARAAPASAVAAVASGPSVSQAPAPEPPPSAGAAPAGTDDAEPSAYAMVAADPGEDGPVAEAAGAPTVITTVPPPVSAPATPPAATPPAQPSPPAAPAPATPRSAAQPEPRPAPTPTVATPAPTPPPPAKAAAAQAAAAPPGYDATWLQRQSASSYVVQLFASREEGAAKRFIGDHGVDGRAAIAPITHNGQRWYVVVYGHYATRQAANQAIAALDPALARLKPWPRLVQSLKP